jgi:hypothetical protein
LPFEVYVDKRKQHFIRVKYPGLIGAATVETFQLFFANGASPDAKMASGQYLCHFLLEEMICFKYRNLKLPMLMCQKSDPSIRGLKGNTMLHQLIECGPQDDTSPLLEVMLQRGSDPNAINDNGQSPLLIFLQKNLWYPPISIRATRMLLQAGADPFFRNELTENAVFAAAKQKNEQIKTSLVKEVLASIINNIRSITLPNSGPDKEWWKQFSKCVTLSEEGDWLTADDALVKSDDNLPEDVRNVVTKTARTLLVEHCLRRARTRLSQCNSEDHIASDGALQVTAASRRTIIDTLQACRKRGLEIDLEWYQLLLDVAD